MESYKMSTPTNPQIFNPEIYVKITTSFGGTYVHKTGQCCLKMGI